MVSVNAMKKGFDLRKSIQAARDEKWTVEKQGRFGARFFQSVLGFGMWYLLPKVPTTYLSLSLINLYWFLSIVGTIMAIIAVGMYLIPALHAWSLRKTFFIETTMDFFFATVWVISFLAGLAQGAGKCSPGSSSDCDQNNWCLAMVFFCAISWLVSLGLDIKTFTSNTWRGGNSEHDNMRSVRRGV
jgi:hypothetical protein